MSGCESRALALALAVVAAAGCASTERATVDVSWDGRPNVVLILVDDLRADSLAHAGHPFIQTPNLDRIAAEGAVFNRSFVVTALCSPSRATLLSGRYPHQIGVTNNGHDFDYRTVFLLPQIMQERGYLTAFLGKYHLGDDGRPRPGWTYWASLTGQGSYFDATLNIDGTERQIPGYSTDVLAEMASDWIVDNQDEPFLLMLWLKNPHTPTEPPPRHRALYADQEIELPASFDDDLQTLPQLLRSEPRRREERYRELEPGARIARTEKMHRNYARAVPSIDDASAAIYRTLKETALLDRTLLIFTSDNGRLLGEHGLMRKTVPYDPSIQVPLLMRFPALIPPGSRIDDLVLNIDLAPTILDVAGIAAPDAMAGTSVRSLFGSPDAEWRDDALFVGPYRNDARPEFFAVRSEHWKFVRYVRGGLDTQLFRLTTDPDERTNLARDPSYAGQLQRLQSRLEELTAREGITQAWLEPSEN